MEATNTEPTVTHKPRRRKRVKQQVLVEQAWKAKHGERLTAYEVAARLFRTGQSVTAVETLLRERYCSGYVSHKAVSDWINRGLGLQGHGHRQSVVEPGWQNARRTGNTASQVRLEQTHLGLSGEHHPYYVVALMVFREVASIPKAVRLVNRRYGMAVKPYTFEAWVRRGLREEGSPEDIAGLRGPRLTPAGMSGEELRALRVELGATQQEVATAMQAGNAHVARVEKGQKTSLEFERRYKTAIRKIKKQRQDAQEQEDTESG